MEVREAAFEKDMATLLTPEQNKKFLANRVKREDRRAQQMEKMEKHMDMKMGK
jgi:Spy/CpxP family protein refolding chaperone